MFGFSGGVSGRMQYDVEDFANILRASNLVSDQNEYTDEQLVSSFLETNPSYNSYVAGADRTMPTGETAVQTPQVEPAQSSAQSFASAMYGGEEGGPDIGEDVRFTGFQFQQQWASLPGSLVGGAAWLANLVGADRAGESLVNVSEELRHRGNEKIQSIIEQDAELAGYLEWMQNEPVTLKNWWHIDMLQRGMAQAMPSIIEMAATTLATGGIASIAGAGLKATNIAKTIAGITTMSGLEGSSQYNEAMSVLVDEKGYDPKIANKIAGTSAALYAPIAGVLEFMPFMKVLDKAGLGTFADKALIQSLVGGVERSMIGNMGVAGIMGAAMEGTTEWAQYMSQQFVNELVVNNPDRPLEESFDQFMAEWKEHATSPEAIESFYSGLVMGKAFGLSSGYIGAASKTPENIAKRISRNAEWIQQKIDSGEWTPEQGQLVFDIEKVSAIKNGTRGMDETEESIFRKKVQDSYDSESGRKDIEITPEGDVVPTEQAEEEILKSYLYNIDAPKEAQFRWEGETPEDANEIIKKIGEDQGKSKGDKILSLISGKPEYLDALLTMPDDEANTRDRLIAAAYRAFKDQYPEKIPGAQTPEAAISLLKLFAEKGTQETVKTEEEGLEGKKVTTEIIFGEDLSDEEMAQLGVTPQEEPELADIPEVEVADIPAVDEADVPDVTEVDEIELGEPVSTTGEEVTPSAVEQAMKEAEDKARAELEAQKQKDLAEHPELFDEEGNYLAGEEEIPPQQIDYNNLIVKDLDAEIKKRNEENPDLKLEVGGLKKDKVKTLEDHDLVLQEEQQPVIPEEELPKGYGDKNTGTTKEKLEQAKKDLQDTSFDLNIGVNPKAMKAMATIASFHVEAGARSFVDFSAAMLKSIGDRVKPYLRKLYEDIRKNKGIGSEGMTALKDMPADEAAEFDASEAYAQSVGFSDWRHVINSMNRRRVEKGMDKVPLTPDQFAKLEQRHIKALASISPSAKAKVPPAPAKPFEGEVIGIEPKDVHKAAEKAGMAWDDDADFMALSKKVTGKERIDDMTSTERSLLIAEIAKIGRQPKQISKKIDSIREKEEESFLEKNEEIFEKPISPDEKVDLRGVHVSNEKFNALRPQRRAMEEDAGFLGSRAVYLWAKAGVSWAGNKFRYFVNLKDAKVLDIRWFEEKASELEKALPSWTEYNIQSDGTRYAMGDKPMAIDVVETLFSPNRKLGKYIIHARPFNASNRVIHPLSNGILLGTGNTEAEAWADAEKNHPIKDKKFDVDRFLEQNKMDRMVWDYYDQRKKAGEKTTANLAFLARGKVAYNAETAEFWDKFAAQYEFDAIYADKMGIDKDPQIAVTPKGQKKLSLDNVIEKQVVEEVYEEQKWMTPEALEALRVYGKTEEEIAGLSPDDVFAITGIEILADAAMGKPETEFPVDKNVASGSPNALLAALTNRTELAKLKGNIKKSYPVFFRGKEYESAEQAYQKAGKPSLEDSTSPDPMEDRVSFMAEIITAKLEQHPELLNAIINEGGADWIESLIHYVGPRKEADFAMAKHTYWEGRGLESGFISALHKAFTGLVEGVESTEELIQMLEEQESVRTRIETSQNIEDAIPKDSLQPDNEEKDITNRDLTLANGKTIKLNNQQESAVVSFEEWSESDSEKNFVLQGYAGTGKTVITKEMVNYLKSKGLKYILSGFTHKAAGVIEDALGEGARTMHSVLGIRANVDMKDFDPHNPSFQPDRDNVTLKELQQADFLFIDEVSMMNPELWEHLMNIARENNIKIVFVGDKGQLPPVKSIISPVFMTKHDDDVIRHELTIVERVETGNPVFNVVTMIREKLWAFSNNAFSHITGMLDSNDKPTNDETKFWKGVKFVADFANAAGSGFMQEAISFFKSEQAKLDGNYAKIITYTNEQVGLYNTTIRTALFGKDAPQFVKGDKLTANLTVMEGTEEYAVRNSFDYTVEQVREVVDEVTGMKRWAVTVREAVSPERLAKKGQPDSKIIYFVQGGKNTKRGKDGWYGDETESEKLAAAEAYRLKRLAQKANRFDSPKLWDDYDKYIASHLTNRTEGLNHITTEFQSTGTKTSPYGGRANVYYGYAVTAHKSQGSTYTNVFIDDASFDSINEANINARGIKNGYSWSTSKFQFFAENDYMKEHNMPFKNRSEIPAAWYESEEYFQKQQVSWLLSNKLKYVAYSRASNRVIVFSSKAGKGADQIVKPVFKGSTVSTNGINIEKQEIGVSREKSMAEAKEEAKAIVDRLAKKFPFITAKALEEIILNNKEYAGISLNMLVAWSKGKATLDTVPHEYAHIYVKIMGNLRVVKQGLEIFKGEENLVQYLGEYYSKRMRDKRNERKMGSWLKKFWLTLKSYFKRLSTEEAGYLIGESFFVGNLKGVDYSLVSNTPEFYGGAQSSNQTEETLYESEDAETMGNNPNTVHITHYFENLLGIHIKKTDHKVLIDFANEFVGDFDAFAGAVEEFFKKEYNKSIWKDSKGELVPEQGGKTYSEFFNSLSVVEKRNFRYLRNAWHKFNSRIALFDPVTSPDGRIIFESVITGRDLGNNPIFELAPIGDIQDVSGSAEAKAGEGGKFRKTRWEKVRDFFVKNFTEEDTHSKRTVYLSYKDIAELITPPGLNDAFYRSATLKISGATLDAWDIHLADIKTGDNVYVYVGSKGGDNSTMLIGAVDEKWWDSGETQVWVPKKGGTSPDFKKFMNYVRQEFEDGNITQEQQLDMIREAKHRIGTGSKQPYAQVIGKHEWWKSIKGNKYMLGTHVGTSLHKEHNVRDSYNRLRIDMAEGYIVRGLGKSSMITLDPKTEVWKEVTTYPKGIKQTNWVKAGTYEDFDGWMIASGSFLNRLTEVLGTGDYVNLFKGVIRHLSEDGNDYVGTKSMMMRPFTNMKFIDPVTNKVIARIKGEGQSTRILSADNREADFIGSTNEVKQTAGRFSEYGTWQELPENFLKLNFFPGQSKETAAFPLSWMELILDPTTETAEVSELIDSMKDMYGDMAKVYTDRLMSFRENPKALRNFLRRKAQEGEIPTATQRMLNDWIGEDGKGIHYPVILNMLLPTLNSILFTEGLHQGKPLEGGRATKLFLKPQVALNIPEGSLIGSWNNKMMRDLVIQEYEKKHLPEGVTLASLGVNPKELLRGSKTVEIRSVPTELQSIRVFLETTDVKIPLLTSRVPIAKVTGVRMMSIKGMILGNHGEVVFMNKEDVKDIFDGDWDGDTVLVTALEDGPLKDRILKFQESESFKNRDKVVELQLFHSEIEGTSLSNLQHTRKAALDMSVAEGTQGLLQNAKQIMSNMSYKELSLVFPSLKGGLHIEPFNNSDVVIMDYIPLSRDFINEKVYNELIKGVGDAIVDWSGKKVSLEEFHKNEKKKFYLQTTKENELSTLLQMSVDDAKFGFIGKIKISNDFIIRKMFKIVDDKSGKATRGKISDEIVGTLGFVRTYFNHSPRRHGYNDVQARKKLRFPQSVENSIELADRFVQNSDPLGLLLNFVQHRIIDRVGKENYMYGNHNYALVEIEQSFMENKSTPMEHLLQQVGIFAKLLNKREQGQNIWRKSIIIKHTDPVALHAKIRASAIRSEVLVSDLSDYTKAEQDIIISNAIEYMDSLVKDWLEIKSAKQVKRDVTLLTEDDPTNLDTDEEYANLADEHWDAFNRLSDIEKRIATVYFLTGYRDVNLDNTPIRKRTSYHLPPPQLLYAPEMQEFLVEWDNQTKEDLFTPGFIESKTKLGTLFKGGVSFRKIESEVTNKTKRICG